MTIRLLALLASLTMGFACSSPSTGTSSGAVDACPSAPSTCPADAPGYAEVVQPIIARACATCHSPTGDANDRLLTTLADVQKYNVTSLTLTASCQMPPDGTPMSAKDRADLLAWYVCGSLDN